MYKYENVERDIPKIITGSSEVESEFKSMRKVSTDPYKAKVSRVKKAAANFSRTAPIVQDPRTSYLSLMVPDDQILLNSMYRYYDNTDPIIQNAHRLHTEFPLSSMTLLDCGDPVIQQHFETMWHERIQGDTFLLDAGIEYNRMGNVVTFGAWNESDYMWDKIAILNQDYVIIEDTWLAQRPLIKLRPDENLKQIVHNQRPKELYNQLHPEIKKYVRMNRDIPLHPANTWHLTYSRAPYEVWGAPPVKSLLKLLFYENKLTEAQTAIAYRHIVPITLVKVGHEGSGWLPDPAELDDVEEILAARELDPNMSIIYHYGLNIEYVGASGAVLPVQQDLTRIDELKMMGLGISKAFLGGEGGPTYSNASVALAVLKQRYLHMTSKFTRFLEQGIFQPVAEACGFYRTNKSVVGAHHKTKNAYGNISDEANKMAKEYHSSTIRDIKDNKEFKEYLIAKAKEKFTERVTNTKEYITPTPDWNLSTLAGDLDWRRWVSEYSDKFQQENGLPFVSDNTMYKLMGLDQESERSSIIREAMERKVRTKVLQDNEIIGGNQPAQEEMGGDFGGGLSGGGGLGGGMPDIGSPPDLEAPLGEPGMEGEGLPTGGGVGEMPTENMSEIPSPAPASKNKERTKTGTVEDALDAAEKDILDSLSEEIEDIS